MLEKAGLNAAPKKEDSKHLLKYYIEGIDREIPPASWIKTLEDIKASLHWNPDNQDGEPFVNIASQVHRDSIQTKMS